MFLEVAVVYPAWAISERVIGEAPVTRSGRRFVAVLDADCELG
jgi:hypothetical protein